MERNESVVVDDAINQWVKGEILKHLERVGSALYPDEIADMLNIDIYLCINMIEELLKGGDVEIAEEL